MERKRYLKEIEQQFSVHSVCALLGPRQVGKTTLAQMYIKKHAKKKVQFFDLENPIHLSILSNPLLTLSAIPSDHLIVIDEIQRRPDLFPVIRVLVDEIKAKKRRFLILGSASRELIQQSSETLAGRIGYIEVTPFSLDEIQKDGLLWVRGGFPRSFLARNEQSSFLWRQSYITTFLERDIPNLGFNIPALQMRRFWLMLAHYHGQIFNANELGKSLGLSDHLVKKYLDTLAGTFMVRVLTPWFENIGKRQIKSPKIYFRDSGIFHAMMDISNKKQLLINPKLGASWEGYALEEIINHLNARPEECFFWRTQAGAELDLFIIKGGRRIGFEFKFSDSPRLTPSMHIAMSDLKLDHLYVIIPGKHHFALSEWCTVYGVDSFAKAKLPF